MRDEPSSLDGEENVLVGVHLASWLDFLSSDGPGCQGSLHKEERGPASQLGQPISLIYQEKGMVNSHG